MVSVIPGYARFYSKNINDISFSFLVAPNIELSYP